MKCVYLKLEPLFWSGALKWVESRVGFKRPDVILLEAKLGQCAVKLVLNLCIMLEHAQRGGRWRIRWERSGEKTRTPSQVSLQAEYTVGGTVHFASDEQEFSFAENSIAQSRMFICLTTDVASYFTVFLFTRFGIIHLNKSFGKKPHPSAEKCKAA